MNGVWIERELQVKAALIKFRRSIRVQTRVLVVVGAARVEGKMSAAAPGPQTAAG